MADDYEYDVAFSFNALDEGVASQLNDLLADRLKTFIYSERQREIAGTDGQQKFSEVYGKTSRLVVVLFRPEWGETPWTRVERDAIKNRSLDEGWDFTTFIPTVAKPQMPPWLPKTRLYVGLERWGIESAAAVIESRLAERGGQPYQETIGDRAARFARANKLKQLQTNFQKSEIGVRAANVAYEEFSAALEISTSKLKDVGVSLTTKRSNQLRIVSGISPINLIADFRPFYANDLEGAHLTLAYYKGFPPINGFYGSIETATKLRELKYGYELVGLDRYAYVGIDERRRELSPSQLADHALEIYLDVAEKNPLRN
jgi:hypothetical protein